MEGKDKGIPGTEKSMCKEPVVGESLGVQALKEGWHSWSMGIGEKGKRQRSGSV